MNCPFAVQLLLFSFDFIYAGNYDKNTHPDLVESADSASTNAGNYDLNTQSDFVESSDSASTKAGNYDPNTQSDLVESTDDSASTKDEEIEDINEFKLLMKNKSFNIQINQNFAEFVHKVFFKYWVLTPDKNVSNIIVSLRNISVLKSKWFVNKPLKMIIHGWRNLDDRYVDFIKNAYLNQLGNFNVVTVHWESIANQINYFKVVSKSNKVGIVTGYFLLKLVESFSLMPHQIHVIGHSIGAHVAGVSGSTFFSEAQIKVSRITGLDPASPGFKDSWFSWETNYRLDDSDAYFVDVIHTAMGFTGMSIQIGHADFYPNNGVSPQPYCKHYNPYNTIFCSHCIVFEYYAQSVYIPNYYKGFECSSMVDLRNGDCKLNEISYMGHDANPSMHGKFYLEFGEEDTDQIKEACCIS